MPNPCPFPETKNFSTNTFLLTTCLYPFLEPKTFLLTTCEGGCLLLLDTPSIGRDCELWEAIALIQIFSKVNDISGLQPGRQVRCRVCRPVTCRFPVFWKFRFLLFKSKMQVSFCCIFANLLMKFLSKVS